MGKPIPLATHVSHSGVVKVKMPPLPPLPSLPEADERLSLGCQSGRATLPLPAVAHGNVVPALPLGSAVVLALVLVV